MYKQNPKIMGVLTKILPVLDQYIKSLPPGHGFYVSSYLKHFLKDHPSVEIFSLVELRSLSMCVVGHLRRKWWEPGWVDVTGSESRRRWVKRAVKAPGRITKSELGRIHFKRKGPMMVQMGLDVCYDAKDSLWFLASSGWGGDPAVESLIEQVLDRKIPDVVIERVGLCAPPRRPIHANMVSWLIGKGPMICQYYRAGWTVAEIADVLSVSVRHIWVVINQMRANDPRAVGDAIEGESKMTEENLWEKITRLFKEFWINNNSGDPQLDELDFIHDIEQLFITLRKREQS